MHVSMHPITQTIRVAMKKILLVKQVSGFVFLGMFMLSCNLAPTTVVEKAPPPILTSTSAYFPFQNAQNWWKYTEKNSKNQLSIMVLDTITDADTSFFKISFVEATRPTTNDWFKQSTQGTFYSSALRGVFGSFLPDNFSDDSGSFMSGGNPITYMLKDTLVLGTRLANVAELSYPNRNFHGFSQIDFAQSIGIVKLIDPVGRLPFVYELDSAYVNGVMYRKPLPQIAPLL